MKDENGEVEILNRDVTWRGLYVFFCYGATLVILIALAVKLVRIALEDGKDKSTVDIIAEAKACSDAGMVPEVYYKPGFRSSDITCFPKSQRP